MNRISFLALAAMVAALPASTASAYDSRYAARPPVVLSPDVSDGWIMQIRPNYRGAVPMQPIAMPAARARAEDASAGSYQQASLMPAPAVRRSPREVDPMYLPQTVAYGARHAPGTVVIDTGERFLYLVEGNGQARRYGIGVGRPGFTWAGVKTITRKAEWPDWRPPPEMLQRQPHLPTFMEGGPNNPLGARAMYLGSSMYRIHGTTEPWTIGQAVSSGCIRLRNEDVVDLYERVKVGTKVIVM